MKTLPRLLLVIVSLCTSIISGCSDENVVKVERPLTPDFILKDLQGNDFQLSKHQGKVVLLDFFLTT